MDLLARDDPSFVGPYRLLARLGQGGMGQVYLARTPTDTLVALKVIHSALAGDAAFRRRFAHEVASAQRVQGRYTVALLASDTEAALPWLVTDYVRGYSLADTVDRRGPLAEGMVRSLGHGLAVALQSVHAAGIVHRDVKPSNVLMAIDGPRLVDFGISRATEASTLTATGQVVGSAGFMAPEQVEGRTVGAEADVFALGAVLVFALTGSGPFGEGSAASLLYRVVHNPPHVPTVQDAVLADIIPRCLAKDPTQRPSPAEVATALGPAPSADFVPPDWLPEQAPTTPTRQPGAGPSTITAVPGATRAQRAEASPSVGSASRRRAALVALVVLVAALAGFAVRYAIGTANPAAEPRQSISRTPTDEPRPTNSESASPTPSASANSGTTTVSATGSDTGGPGPSPVFMVHRTSGPAGFESGVTGVQCPALEPGYSHMIVITRGAAVIWNGWEGFYDWSDYSSSSTFRVLSAFDAEPGTYTAYVNCEEFNADYTISRIVKTYQFTQVVTATASNVDVNPSGDLAPGTTITISDGGGCGPYPLGQTMTLKLDPYDAPMVTQTLAVDANGHWGPVSMTLPTPNTNPYNYGWSIYARCDSADGSGYAYFNSSIDLASAS